MPTCTRAWDRVTLTYNVVSESQICEPRTVTGCVTPTGTPVPVPVPAPVPGPGPVPAPVPVGSTDGLPVGSLYDRCGGFAGFALCLM